MHFFVYEWITGGGIVDEPGSLPASLLREGTTMVESLAGDLARIEGARVTVLREPRVLRLVLPRCEIVDVQSAAHQREEFERLASAADATIVIAPEFPIPLRYQVINGRLLPCANNVTAPALAPGAVGVSATVTTQLCPAV